MATKEMREMTVMDDMTFMPGRTLAAAPGILEMSRTGLRREVPFPACKPGCCEARDEAAVVRMIWHISEEYTFYGYRRVAAELRRRGLVVNRKRVRRIMHEEWLHAIPPRRNGFGYREYGGYGDLEGPGHWTWGDEKGAEGGNEDYGAGACGEEMGCPNLLADLTVDRPDIAWAADMTCIRIEKGFVFLAAVMDLYSRRCLGWSLGASPDAGHAIRALRKAVRARAGKELSGLVHHSDNGSVYDSEGYRALMESRGIRMSRSRPGYPYENGCMERFFRTLKEECAGLRGCLDFQEALEEIGDFIGNVYNPGRLHSAIGYMPPVELETAAGVG